MRIIDLQGDEYADDDQDDLAQGVAGIPLQDVVTLPAAAAAFVMLLEIGHERCEVIDDRSGIHLA